MHSKSLLEFAHLPLEGVEAMTYLSFGIIALKNSSSQLHCFELYFVRLHRSGKAPYANLVYIYIYIYGSGSSGFGVSCCPFRDGTRRKKMDLKPMLFWVILVVVQFGPIMRYDFLSMEP